MNLNVFTLASTSDPIEELRSQAGQAAGSPISRDLLIVIGIGVFLALLVMIWAAYIRKPRSGTLERAQSQSSTNRPSNPTSSSRRGRRRKGTSEYRERNPTLAETRGLPPLKPQAPDAEKIKQP